MKPTIINDSGMEISEELMEKWVQGITAELFRKKVLNSENKDKELGLVFLGENDAKKLNWNYRCKDYPTDILSFDSEDPTTLGELVLCPQVIIRQAKDHGISQEEEFGYTILHGVLHLLGYDHEKSKENEALMMGLQDEVFENLRNPKKASVKNKEKTSKTLEAVKEPVKSQENKKVIKIELKKTQKHKTKVLIKEAKSASKKVVKAAVVKVKDKKTKATVKNKKK